MSDNILITQFESIAVYQTAFIGDIALSLFLLQAIKNIHPGCKLTFVTTRAGAGIAKNLKCLDHIIVYDKRSGEGFMKGIRRIAGLLKDHGTDCFISAHRSTRSPLIAQALSVFSVGYDKAQLSFLFKKRAAYNIHRHEAERLADLLGVFADAAGQKRAFPEISLPDGTAEHLENMLLGQKCDISRPKALLAPGSVWATKRWPPGYFMRLAEELKQEGMLPVFIGGKEDAALVTEKQQGIGNLIGHTDFTELMALMKISELLISNDSSPVHFASLTGLKTIALFGPTSPAFGFSPLAENSMVVYKGLECSPCSIHGQKSCPLGHHDCMRLIEPSEIRGFAAKLIKL